MAYGISITGNDTGGNYTVTDTALDLVNYAVVATGTGYQVDLTSTQGQRPILLVNGGTATANQGKVISGSLSGNYRNFKRISFTVSGTTGEKEIETVADASGLSWILLKDMTGITPPTSAGTYGLQIFTAAGATAFDSRSLLTNSTAQIKAVWGPGTRSGNNASLTTDPDLYCDSDWFFYQDTSEGDSLSGVLWNVSGTLVGVRFQNWINLGLEEFGGSSTTHFSNFSTIVLGE